MLTGPDAIPENAGEPEGDADLDGSEHDVVRVPAAQIDPETKTESYKCYTTKVKILSILINQIERVREKERERKKEREREKEIKREGGRKREGDEKREREKERRRWKERKKENFLLLLPEFFQGFWEEESDCYDHHESLWELEQKSKTNRLTDYQMSKRLKKCLKMVKIRH